MDVWIVLWTSRDGSRDEVHNTDDQPRTTVRGWAAGRALPWREGSFAACRCMPLAVDPAPDMQYGVYPGRVHSCPGTSCPRTLVRGLLTSSSDCVLGLGQD